MSGWKPLGTEDFVSPYPGYDRMVRYYLRPRLGHLRLDQLTVRGLEAHYGWLLARGRPGRPTTQPTHRRPDPRRPPRQPRGRGPYADTGPTQVRSWSAGQVGTFLEATRDHELADLWRVALGTGMRRGELLGLQWSDVDLPVPQVQVAASLAHVHGQLRLKTTKTRRRVRTLHLDDATAAIDRQPRRQPRPLPGRVHPPQRPTLAPRGRHRPVAPARPPTGPAAPAAP